jgi:uncharacterized membrane protein YphA (DoxX/SURF4 family)
VSLVEFATGIAGLDIAIPEAAIGKVAAGAALIFGVAARSAAAAGITRSGVR